MTCGVARGVARGVVAALGARGFASTRALVRLTAIGLPRGALRWFSLRATVVSCWRKSRRCATLNGAPSCLAITVCRALNATGRARGVLRVTTFEENALLASSGGRPRGLTPRLATRGAICGERATPAFDSARSLTARAERATEPAPVNTSRETTVTACGLLRYM